MKKNTKAIALLMSAVCTIGLLAGCGNKQSANSTPVSSEPTSKVSEAAAPSKAEETKEEAAPVDVTTISWWSGDSHNKELMEQLVNDFNNTVGKEKGIAIDYKVIGGDSAAQATELALQSGVGPDLFTKGSMKTMAEEGIILALEDLSGGDELLARYEGKIPSGFISGGKTYRVPITATTRALIYNKDMFVEAGLVDENGEATPPKTYDELREYAQILTDESSRKYGIIWPIKWGGWYSSDIADAVFQAKVSSFNYETGTYDYSGMKPVLECFAGMYADGSVYPGADSVDNDSARALFAEGVIGMKFAYSFDVGVLNDQFPAKCDWGVAPLPVLDENERYTQVMTYSGSPYINARSAAEPEKLLEVYKFITSDEVAIAKYKQGYDVPWNWDIVADAELSADAPKGFKEFCQMASISELKPSGLKADITGENNEIVELTPFLTGNRSIDELDETLEVLTDRLNAGIDRYYEANPDSKEDDSAVIGWKQSKADASSFYGK